ncbi:MAG: hypothetical protein Q8L69_02190 [Gallionellaceae bacterium]|nr:hypothetical protein [Gallionellaceae bacterium]
MTTAPQPRWISVPILLVLLFGGGFAGEQVAAILAPDSVLARFISIFALPVSLVLGLVLWLGSASLIAIKRRMKRTGEQSQTQIEEHEWGKTIIPPGSMAFFFSSIFPCAIVGVLVGLFSEAGFAWCLFSYIGIGTVYGLVCWKLAENGYLPFPDE